MRHQQMQLWILLAGTKRMTPWFFMAMCALLVCTGTARAQRIYLVVDRLSGATKAVSSADVAVDGYSITSPSGLLDVDKWNSLEDQGADWTEANPKPTILTELTLGAGGLAAGTEFPLGSPYKGTPHPNDEDLAFKWTAGAVNDGTVVYTGASPLPTITVNRGTGAIELSNPGGFGVDGYSISSPSGLLKPDGLAGLGADWTPANPTTTLVSELSFNSSLTFPGTFNLGTVFDPAGGVPLVDEDLSLEYSTPNGTIATGVVNYVGAVNDLTLQVDQLTGAARISHMTPHVGDIEMWGYSITSESSALDVTAWNRFGSDFIEANPSANAIAELSAAGSKTFTNGTEISLGNILAGAEDLTFTYGTPNGSAVGSVQYVFGGGTPTCEDIASSRLVPGDLNGDNTVTFSDFLVLSTNFNQAVGGYEDGDIDCNGTVGFSDFLVLSTNFNKTAEASATAVPEPASAALASLAMLMCLAWRKRRK